ncbi:MAG: hypothetical protein AAGE52_37415, partial [Myxococcota bacterium]
GGGWGGGGGGGGGGESDAVAAVPQASSVALPVALVAAVGLGVAVVAWPRGAEEAPVVAAAVEETAALEAPGTPGIAPPAPVDRVDEGALLERARRLVCREPERAGAALERHRSRFPNGVLSEEREALGVELLHCQERHDDARAALAEFAGAHPGSVHLPRLRTLVAP